MSQPKKHKISKSKSKINNVKSHTYRKHSRSSKQREASEQRRQDAELSLANTIDVARGRQSIYQGSPATTTDTKPMRASPSQQTHCCFAISRLSRADWDELAVLDAVQQVQRETKFKSRPVYNASYRVIMHNAEWSVDSEESQYGC